MQGHFNCKHSHCSERNDGDFLHATGYIAADFENLELSTDKEGIWDKPVDVSLLLRTHPTPIEWLIPDRIQMGRGILLTGVGGSSKTRAMYHLAIGAAIVKLPWNWKVNTTGKSLLVLTEDTKNDAVLVYSPGLSFVESGPRWFLWADYSFETAIYARNEELNEAFDAQSGFLFGGFDDAFGANFRRHPLAMIFHP